MFTFLSLQALVVVDVGLEEVGRVTYHAGKGGW